jgi:hypothetical protein
MLVDLGVALEERLIEANPFLPKFPTALRIAVIIQVWGTVVFLIEKGASLEILIEPCEEHTPGPTDFFENCRPAGPKYFPAPHDDDRKKSWLRSILRKILSYE